METNDERLREMLASLSHEIWAHWMKYLFSRCDTEIYNLGPVIDWSDAERWLRQIDTTYTDLTEREKDSDREQADKIIAVLKEFENNERARMPITSVSGSSSTDDDICNAIDEVVNGSRLAKGFDEGYREELPY